MESAVYIVVDVVGVPVVPLQHIVGLLVEVCCAHVKAKISERQRDGAIEDALDEVPLRLDRSEGDIRMRCDCQVEDILDVGRLRFALRPEILPDRKIANSEI